MSESSICADCGQLAHFKPCSEVNKPRCFCGKVLEISPPIPEGKKADPGTTYNFLCPEHGDATSAESNYRRMVEAEAERDELRRKGEGLCSALGNLMLECRRTGVDIDKAIWGAAESVEPKS